LFFVKENLLKQQTSKQSPAGLNYFLLNFKKTFKWNKY